MSDLDIVVMWIILSVVNAGFVNAYFRAEIPPRDRREARKELVFCVGASLVPIIWIFTPFFTGFYMDGWTLSGSVDNERK